MKKTPPPSSLQDFCKKAQWRAKKTPARPSFFLQDFCKNAQWRAKKLRERGSSTARPTEKGVGGLQIGARRVDFGASIRSISVDFGRVASRFANFILAFRPDSVDSVDFGASIRSISVDFGRVASRFANFILAFRPDSVDFGASKPEAQTQKEPDSSIGESGLSYRKVSCALNLLLAPLSSTCASAQGVLLGLARRSCIVMITSDRRCIGRYI